MFHIHLVQMQTGFENIDKMLDAARDELTRDESVFLFFYGNVDETSGKSWCSDCDNAKPIINPLIDEKKVKVLAMPVGSREEWRADQNLFRNHRLLDLTSVPTLLQVKMNDDGELIEKMRLGDRDCQDKSKVLNLFSQS
ncbi:hypothetical protein Ciccas_001797 [Cichlidogyrus casuarinus]|uniref:Thioredoxin domain-containing protein 17 n=1 Tax=Cichlidogyrus casuarinus TaxID=1844966 RepID=A0ABD2QLB9_9PLAT